MANDHFYLTARHQGRRAVILLAQDPNAGWKLRSQTPRWWPDGAATSGPWSGQGWGEQTNFTHCLNGLGGKELFRLGDVTWPPDIEDNARFLYKAFIPEEAWRQAAPGTRQLRTSHDGANWQVVITGPLLTSVRQKFEEIQQEIIQIGVQAGIDTMSILDPTGLLSVGGAAYAMRNGDYLGCAMSLLGVIPVVGKACDAAKLARAGTRLARARERLEALKELITNSARSTKEAGLSGEVIHEEVQGTKIGHAVQGGHAAGGGRAVRALTTGADLTRAATDGGVALNDVKTLQKFSMDNNAISVVRYTSRNSLVRQADVLNTGKPCNLASFHTAHDESTWSGLIVVRREQVASHTFVDGKGVRRIKDHPEYSVSDFACPKTGDRLITHDGVAYYSDYDFMGMYHGNGKSYLDFKELNDDHGIVAFMNRLMPGGGQKINHGMQDFFKRLMAGKGKDGRDYVKMGRQPGIDETFLFFEPSGKVSYVDLRDLFSLYKKYNIEWPYRVFGRADRLRNRLSAAASAAVH